jgi:hypothetical protein
MLIRFPMRRVPAVLVLKDRDDDWLALAGSHGWSFGSRADAFAEAQWLSENLGGLPVRFVGGTT